MELLEKLTAPQAGLLRTYTDKTGSSRSLLKTVLRYQFLHLFHQKVFTLEKTEKGLIIAKGTGLTSYSPKVYERKMIESLPEKTQIPIQFDTFIKLNYVMYRKEKLEELLAQTPELKSFFEMKKSKDHKTWLIMGIVSFLLGGVLLPFISLFSIIFFVLGVVMAVSSFKKELMLTAEGKEQQKALKAEINEVIEWLKKQPNHKASLKALEQRMGANIFLLPNEFDKEVKEIFKQVEKEVLEEQEKGDTSYDSFWWFTVYNTDYTNRSALFDFSDANNSDLDGAFDSASDSSSDSSSSGDSGCSSGCGGCGGD